MLYEVITSEKEKPISSVRIKTEGNARVISIKPTGEWKHHYHLSIESFRGLPASDDHFVPGIIQTKLEEGGTITLCLSPEHGDSCNFSPREDEIHYQESLIRTVITSYSIHYTKLYEPPKSLRPHEQSHELRR